MTQVVADYVVVGAGSAGCALAARLVAGGHSVILLEAGNDDRWIWLRIPAGVAHILRLDRSMRRFYTEPEPQLNHRKVFWPRGRVLGGSSSINGMIWAHGDPVEFDRWRDEFDLPGWGSRELKPYFQAIENYADKGAADRGRAGPVHVTEYSPRQPLMDAFLQACISAGVARNDDYNGATYEGVGYLQFNTRRGWRWGGRDAFLRQARRSALLQMQTDALVHRVRFEGTRAVGVEYSRADSSHEALARREVILCAGAIQSPQLLELSGVGDAQRLQSHGIAVVHHLPAVGEHLQDHLHTRLTYECRGAVTLNQIMPSTWRKGLMAARWALRGNGLMSCSGQIIHALAKSSPSLAQPDIKLQLHWLSSPDARDPNKLVLDDYPGVSIGTFPLLPKSRGSVHIQSSDPRQAPAMRANYLACEEDRLVTLAAIAFARTIASQPALAPFLVREARPGPDVRGADELLDYVRGIGQTSYHPIGSCRMGGDAASVVDAQLRVRGVHGLRVADASVMPTMCSSNTNAAAMVIGEKAAEFIGNGAGAAAENHHSPDIAYIHKETGHVPA